MEIRYLAEQKRCEIWLTGAEAADGALRQTLKPLFKQNKSDGILTAVFESGQNDLYASVLALLQYNKTRLAELELQREKSAVSPHVHSGLAAR